MVCPSRPSGSLNLSGQPRSTVHLTLPSRGSDGQPRDAHQFDGPTSRAWRYTLVSTTEPKRPGEPPFRAASNWRAGLGRCRRFGFKQVRSCPGSPAPQASRAQPRCQREDVPLPEGRRAGRSCQPHPRARPARSRRTVRGVDVCRGADWSSTLFMRATVRTHGYEATWLPNWPARLVSPVTLGDRGEIWRESP